MSVNNRGVAKTCCRSNRKTLFLTPFSENWIKLDLMDLTYFQWDFQDPKMEVLYHVRAIFWGYILLHSPYIGLIYGRYLQFRFLKWPLIFKTN